MMTPEDISAAMEDRNLSAVSRATGLSYDTVRRVAKGGIDESAISYATIKKLSDYLAEHAK